VRRRYVIAGAVQGVGFRFFASRQGRRLGLRGWVRNLPDGRVEVVAEGDAAHLAEFESVLARGPALASVTSVQQAEIADELEGLAAFEIR
jgi:acylphosphatase